MRTLSLERVAIIGDTHMGDGGGGDNFLRNAPTFLKFCSFCERDNRTLLIAGDVWELLAYSWEDIYSRHAPAFQAMIRLANANLLILIMGNHDDGAGIMRGFMPRVVFDYLDIESGGRVIHVEHGHRFDPLNAHTGFWQRLVVRLDTWLEEHRVDGEFRRFRRLDEQLKQAAGKFLAQKEYDAVVFGHSHILCEESYSTPNGVRSYYNPGTWCHPIPHAVMVDSGRIELCQVTARKEVVVDE
jgi:UDP-2,3-diacylglucosamine pyrophosphatase LpxH